MVRRLFCLTALALLGLAAAGCTVGVVPPRAAVPTAAVAAVVPSLTALPSATPTATSPPTTTPLPSPTVTATVAPTDTPVPTETPPPPPTRTPQPTATPDPATLVNGVPVSEIVVMPQAVRDNVRRIYAKGQKMGRNPHAFSKLGDSISLTTHYFARFDRKQYELGPYAALQPTVDYYRKSYERFGMAVRIGLHAWIAFRPGLADAERCQPDEHMVECEFRLHNPSVLLIRLGTNDTAPGDAFERAMRFAVEYSISQGVIPVLATKADRFEGDNRHNETIRALAAEYDVPLWDFDAAAAALPDRGLGGDAVHLTMIDNDDFSDPETLQHGYPLSDLTGLMMLDAIRQIVDEGAAY